MNWAPDWTRVHRIHQVLVYIYIYLLSTKVPRTGPTSWALAPCGPRVLFMQDPCGTHILFRWDHALFRWDPCIIQVGPTYYSSGTHVLFSWDSPWVPLFFKKICFFHYFKIQNIFNYFLYINIIARLCILRSHVVALLFFELCFHFISSKNIIEIFIHR